MSTRKPLRIKKLSPKTALPVLREEHIDPSEYDSLGIENQIVTGVESNEEKEIHLQVALQGAGHSNDNEIPVPPPQASEDVNYDELYPNRFEEPRNYIKFSDTVEETLGCLYDMTTEDDEYLKTYNAKKPANAQLSEDDFERIMDLFESTVAEQAPFASVDNTVVPYEVMAQHMTGNFLKLQTHTKQVYEYWKARRLECGNKSLQPSLKFETHQENDDLDPYVCFRRREVRQTRKTRGRDVQAADKLKKLRRELEDGRKLVVLSHQREVMKRDFLKAERLLFEQRAKLKEKKLRLGIKADEEDLYNTKPPKRKISETQTIRAPQRPVRPDRPQEPELTQLQDVQAERMRELQIDIAGKINNHKSWNRDHIDLTDAPLPPVKEDRQSSFRPARAQFLPTPPASSDSTDLEGESTLPEPAPKGPAFIFQAKPPEPDSMPLYRRRIGRLGRQYIDRRPARMATPPSDADWSQSDRFKYDQDDSEDEQPVYHIDPLGTEALRFRAKIPPSRIYPTSLNPPQQAALAEAAVAAQQRRTLPPPPPPPPQPPPQPQLQPASSPPNQTQQQAQAAQPQPVS